MRRLNNFLTLADFQVFNRKLKNNPLFFFIIHLRIDFYWFLLDPSPDPPNFKTNMQSNL